LLADRYAADDATPTLPPAEHKALAGDASDSKSGVIEGIVRGTDRSGDSVDLRVTMLLTKDGKPVREVRSNGNGEYSIADVEAGAYRLTARQFELIPLPFSLPDVRPVLPPSSVDSDGGQAQRYADYIDRLARLDGDREQYMRDLWDSLKLSGERERQTEIFEAVVKAANDYRESQGRSKLNLEHPLRAHPELDLFVGPDSKHPMKQMGCTVCHGGNGDETSFTTASHTTTDHKQEEHWIEQYEGRIDYGMAQHWWKQPMLAAEYVQASCAKCHTDVADVSQHENRPLATKITQGRQLFTQTGCINCHKVEDLDQARKVGPDLVHIDQKLSPEFAQQWIWYPRDFRPSTWMPHFFKQENNFAKSDLPNDPDPDPKLRTETEVAAISHWLFTFSTDYEREPPPADLTGDVENGRKLFDTVGCLACHGALNHRRKADGETLGVQWIAADLAHREKLDSTRAVLRAKGMTYAEQVRYAMEHLSEERRDRMEALKERLTRELVKANFDQDRARAEAIQKRLDEEVFVPGAFTRFGPELSGIGSKVSVEWLYDWVRNPRHYHSYGKMPRLRLSEQEALDVVSYLATLKNDAFEQRVFEIDDSRAAMRDTLIIELLEGQNSKARAKRILGVDVNDEKDRLTLMLKKLVKTVPDREAAEAKIDQLDGDGRRLLFLGNKMINHYGCASCHAIPGFERTTRPGTELTEWSEKPLNKLDFAFFEHVFLDKRGEEYELLYPESETFEHLVRDGGQRDVHPMHSHASFAWHKMRNPRIWDRGKVKSAYAKLKMPNFFFTDDEAEALTTYLRSRVQPLVSDRLIPSQETHLPAIAAGRNLTAEMNCVACHEIEGNSATMHQFILTGEFEAASAGDEDEDEEGDDEWDEEGGEEEEEEDEWGDDEGGEAEAGDTPDDGSRAVIAAGSGGEYDQVNGPPWLHGEGAKVQPAWLDDFLHNVETLRPWLRVRMPSFYLTNEQSTILVEYFAAASQRESEMLRRHLAPVRKYLDKAMADSLSKNETPPEGRTPGDEWFRLPQYKKSARFLSQYAIDNRLNELSLATAYHGDPASDDLAAIYMMTVRKAEFFEELLDVAYPFGAEQREVMDEVRFDLGREMTIVELDCLACHALGDPNVPGAKQNPSAPNLSLAYRRLRRDWTLKWLQEPVDMQPGTNMPQWFAGGNTAFADFPDPAQMEEKFGATGDEQMRLLLDFLHEAGARSYTGIKGQPPAAEASVSGGSGEKQSIEE
ncbi:MAG: c-type cytochrome, partial [Planctomycetes bacterium]|nr:c-type cytochrome [Planctomycetota bacterium]